MKYLFLIISLYIIYRESAYKLYTIKSEYEDVYIQIF